MQWYTPRSYDPHSRPNLWRGLVSGVIMLPILIGVLVLINSMQSSMSSFWPNVFFGGFLVGDLFLIRRAVLFLRAQR